MHSQSTANSLLLPELFDQLATAIFVLDSRLHVRYANAAAEMLVAGSGRRLIGAPFESLFRYCSLSLLLLHDVLGEQKSLTDSDVALVLHDSKAMTVELTATPAKLSQQDSLLIEMRQVDLIRRLNQEQVQQHQLAAAQQLVRGLAHEIKNPLGGIRGAAQLLQAELGNKALQEYTQMIMSQADRLRGLVDRLLGPTKVGEREWVNIHAVIARALEVLNVNRPAGVKVVQDYDPSLPELEMCADQVEQVMLNLIKNASEAMGNEGT